MQQAVLKLAENVKGSDRNDGKLYHVNALEKNIFLSIKLFQQPCSPKRLKHKTIYNLYLQVKFYNLTWIT